MILGHGHPVVGDPIGANRRALDEMLHMRKGPHTAGGIFTVETQHVDGRIEWLPLHGALEGGVVPPITLHPAGPLRDLPALPAIETGDLVALLEQGPHEARADMAGATDDADFHARNPPLRWCGRTIAGSVTPKLSAMACRLLHQS